MNIKCKQCGKENKDPKFIYEDEDIILESEFTLEKAFICTFCEDFVFIHYNPEN